MAVASGRFVIDIGNTRVKAGLAGSAGTLERTWAFSIDSADLWNRIRVVIETSTFPRAGIAVSSVNPPVAARLQDLLEGTRAFDDRRVEWFRSAADVPVSHRIKNPETAGADRALAVLAALDLLPEERPGLLVSCGTAITVERISPERTWEGGAIAAGLALTARALNQNTAQLPAIEPRSLPAAWGNSTKPALEAGIFWGVVGAVRELIRRQRDDLAADPQILWTGGDAELLASVIEPDSPKVVPDLVLIGLLRATDPNRSERR